MRIETFMAVQGDPLANPHKQRLGWRSAGLVLVLLASTGMTAGCAGLLGDAGEESRQTASLDADRQAADGALLDQSRQLESGDILAIVANNTLNHGPFQEFYAADGTVTGRISGGDIYTGRWALDSDSRVCTELPDFGAEGCAEVYATPDNDLLFVTADDRITRLSVESGDRVTDPRPASS
ncbi:hypothetical protein [Fodinicurvata sp. EGI_FJ10296]|uniref:hypothetical protein n=1 Tax=Fodinicurvata sp. EGI_FJ10296 TaxID=3231908 RepID=UPI00345572F4